MTDVLERLKNYIPGENTDCIAERIAEAADEIERLRALLDAGLWQPIETAPQDGSPILATGGGLAEAVDIVTYNEQVGAWNATNYTLDDRDDEIDGYSRPTHWMPLPGPAYALPLKDGESK